MRIATWNVNSLRTRLAQILEWAQATEPEILAIQETKVQDAEFPHEALAACGYHCLYNGQKTYNGVAILSRTAPRDVVRDLPDFDDPQRRLLGATYGSLRLVNVYVPNGENVASDKYRYKLQWLDRLIAFIEQELSRHLQLVVLGDFNVAPEPGDVYDPESWEGRVLFSEPERAAFRRLLAAGLGDTFRLHHAEHGLFSWWDYRMAAFRRNLGLRIDHILASPALCAVCTQCTIDRTPRGWERPSDHAPVVAEFDMAGISSAGHQGV